MDWPPSCVLSRLDPHPAHGASRRGPELVFHLHGLQHHHTRAGDDHRPGLDDPALRAIAEIVHDIDVKDAKYGREEAPGIGQLVAGIATAHPDDEGRLVRGAALFDDLYAVHAGATKH